MKKDTKRIHVSITLPAELWERTKAFADSKRQPASWWVEMLIEKALPKEQER